MIREAIQFEKSMNCLPKIKNLTERQCYEDRRKKIKNTFCSDINVASVYWLKVDIILQYINENI